MAANARARTFLIMVAGVTGSALAMVDSRDGRARFVAWAMKYSKNFLRGFTPDGYCTEGLGYWNYGFGNFAAPAEMVRQATSGRIDLLAGRRPACPRCSPIGSASRTASAPCSPTAASSGSHPGRCSISCGAGSASAGPRRATPGSSSPGATWRYE
ncbi:MAG: hypothetical protein ABIF82_01475 [Planctomycetota bacterium]